MDRYIHPLPVDVTLADAVDERPVLFGEDHLGNLALVDLSFPVRYGSYQYRDEYLDVEQENPRLTAKSVLDLVNSSLGNEEVWTLTSRNFDAHADILLPRAVGYSAGFLDRFLRGRIEISAPGRQYYARTDQRKADGSPGTFDFLVVGLRNATPDFEMPTQTAVPQPITSGTMTLIARYHRNGCYDKELNGEFDENFVIPKFPPCSFFEYRGEEEISVSNEKVLAEVIPSDFPLDFVFDFTDKPIPVDARDITLRILFESEVGGQQEIIVGSKDISEPNFVSMINSTDYYNLNGTLYPAQQILDSDALLSQVDPDLAVARQQVTPGPVDNIRFSINGEPVASVTSLPVHGYNRFAILTDPGNINLSVRTGQGLTESTIDGGAFQSFLDKDAGGYRVSLIKKFRGLNYFFIFFSIKSTGDIPADPFILPVIESPDPVFFPDRHPHSAPFLRRFPIEPHASGRAGSIAFCSSASIHPGEPAKGRSVGLFEPIHGSAPRLVGNNTANPTGAYLALIAALEWFPDTVDLARTLRRALVDALSGEPKTKDIATEGEPFVATKPFAERVNACFEKLAHDREKKADAKP